MKTFPTLLTTVFFGSFLFCVPVAKSQSADVESFRDFVEALEGSSGFQESEEIYFAFISGEPINCLRQYHNDLRICGESALMCQRGCNERGIDGPFGSPCPGDGDMESRLGCINNCLNMKIRCDEGADIKRRRCEREELERRRNPGLVPPTENPR